MKILFLTRSTLAHPGRGGMEVHTHHLLEGLMARGHEVTVLTTARPDGVRTEEATLGRTHYLEDTPCGRYSDAWWRASLRWIDGLAREARPDVILAQSGAADAYLHRRRRQIGVPVVSICHGITRWTLAAQLRNLTGPRSLYQAATLVWLYLSEHLKERLSGQCYDAVVCVSEPLARAFCRDFGYASDRVVCVPNGIDVEAFSFHRESRDSIRTRLGFGPADVVALVSGRLERDKGVHLAVEALHRLAAEAPPSNLLVIGGGPEEGRLKARTAASGLADRVRFVGHVDPGEVAGYHSASDLHLFPTLLNESFGLGLLEAMACGRPLVAPLVGGTPMLLEEGVTGLSFRPGDAGGMARALGQLARSGELRQRLGSEGARRARRFTRQAMVDGIEAVLRRVAADRETGR